MAIIDSDVVPIYSGDIADLPAVIDVQVEDQEAGFKLLVRSTTVVYGVTSVFGDFGYGGFVDGYEVWQAPNNKTYGNMDGEDVALEVDGYQDNPFFQFHIV